MRHATGRFSLALLSTCLCGLLPLAAARADKCPDMIILLDRSFSMTGQKWESAVAAVETFTEARQGIMRFGLVLFPWEDSASPSCGSASWIVPCEFYTADRIAAELGWTTQGGETPTAPALEAVREGLDLSDGDRARFIILVTDGDPTCPGATLDANVDLSVAVLERLREEGIYTFVIGFGAEVSPARLNRLAEAGGMARADGRCRDPIDPEIEIDCAYFDASDRESLMRAFNEIVAIAQGELSGRTCDDSCYVIDGCPEGERCVARVVDYGDGLYSMNLGRCVDDPCFEVDCAKDQFCREGRCVAACLTACPTDQVCRDGSCVAPATDERSCAETCPKYLVCMDGSCVDDPCRDIDCPSKAPYCYRGNCYATGSEGDGSADGDASIPGGESSDSGCGCRQSPEPPEILLIALLLVSFARRRSKCDGR